MVTLHGVELTNKEFISLYVFLHPNCRGYEIRHAHFEAKFGYRPATKKDRDWNGSLTSCNCGGGLADAKKGQGMCVISRREDRILLKNFHCKPRNWYSPYYRRPKPPTFTLTKLGEKYAASALAKLSRAGIVLRLCKSL
jgi:hypothetical protein